MTTDDPEASLHIAAGIAAGRAEVLAAACRLADLTARPVCGAPRLGAVALVALVEHVIDQGWPIDAIIAREEYREPDFAAAGRWGWAIYRDDDAMMAELRRRAGRGPA